ncbi:MAG: UDP-N-acetylmuramoyl-tripeptide--D-alanyl-D-alanine ligase, partial [Candidatus Gracilibacteria bacterium]
MKQFLRKTVLFILKKLAFHRLRKFKGKVVAVTGSIGKTSTKEAIYSVLNSQFKVKATKKSMNSEFGLLLTILDIDSGYSSACRWSWLILKAFYNALLKDHSEILLLELGVDKAGDMDFLTSIIKPDVAVMTNVFPVHMEAGQFDSLQAIFDEKRKLVDNMKPDGVAVLNIDNPFLSMFAQKRGKKNTITYGKEKEAMFRASALKLSEEGVSFILHFGEDKYEVKSSILGEFQLYVLLPAIVCGKLLGMTMEASIAALQRYELPPGRMSIIPAINDAVILDSSYNSSPEPLKEALKVLKEIGSTKRKVAVLGSMNELGSNAKELHEQIGELIPEYVDFLITVGEEAKTFANKAKEKGMEAANVHSFDSAAEAAEFFKDKIGKNDLVLVKGSQNKVRLEKFIKEIMAH